MICMHVGACASVCDMSFDLLRPPSQGPASYQIKATSRRAMKGGWVCMHVLCRGLRCGGDGSVFVAFNPGQWHCKGESKWALFELMKQTFYTSSQSCPLSPHSMDFSPWFPSIIKQKGTKHFIHCILVSFWFSLSNPDSSKMQIHQRAAAGFSVHLLRQAGFD